MTLPSLDQAESALDWIGVAFADGDDCFEGELAADDAELIDAVLADPETPEPVRALATALRALLAAAGDADARVRTELSAGTPAFIVPTQPLPSKAGDVSTCLGAVFRIV